MTDANEDVIYRGFKLSAVHQTDGWMVTVWPTSVNQALPEGGNVPSQATTREEALERAKRSIDRLPEADARATDTPDA